MAKVIAVLYPDPGDNPRDSSSRTTEAIKPP